MRITFSQLRIFVCVILGALLINEGINTLNTTDWFAQPYSPMLIAFGVLLIIFGFRPSVAKDIVKGITRILGRN